MLQITQTEKPRCSATIDQIRLRRATLTSGRLPEGGVLGVPVGDPAARSVLDPGSVWLVAVACPG